MQQIEDRSPGATDMQEAGRGGGEAEFHRSLHRARESSTTRFRTGAERGFTLAEVLVAILILSIVATTSVAAFLGRTRQMRQAREITLAYQALANEAEYRRRIAFNELPTAQPAFLSDTTLLAPLMPYAATVRVEQVRPGLRNVTMTIVWQERKAELVVGRVDTGGGTFW